MRHFALHSVRHFACQNHHLQQPQSWEQELKFVTLLVRYPNHNFCFPLGLLHDSCTPGCAAVDPCQWFLIMFVCTYRKLYLGVYTKCDKGLESPLDKKENNSETPTSHKDYLKNSRQYVKNLNIYISSIFCQNFSLFSSS